MTDVNSTTTVSADIVRAAGAAVPAAMAEFEAAKEAVIAAAAAQEVAEARAGNARHDDDPAAIVAAVEQADLVLRRAKVLAMVCASKVASTRQHYADVLSDSLAPEHDAGRADRMEACKAIDAARAAMAEGIASFYNANKRLQKVYAQGRKRQFDGGRLDPAVPFPVDLMQPGFWQVNESELWGQA